MARMLYLESGDGRWIVRMTAGGEVFYAPEHMVNVPVAKPIPARVYPIHHRSNVPTAVLHFRPRVRKEV